MYYIILNGEATNLYQAIYKFDVGQLNSSQVRNLFQQIIDRELWGEVPESFKGACEVFVRCGICHAKN